MGANVFWRVLKKGKELRVDAPSLFRDNMERAFQAVFPLTLSKDCIGTLQGMSAMCGKGEDNPYAEIVNILQDFEAIEIYLEY